MAVRNYPSDDQALEERLKATADDIQHHMFVNADRVAALIREALIELALRKDRMDAALAPRRLARPIFPEGPSEERR